MCQDYQQIFPTSSGRDIVDTILYGTKRLLSLPQSLVNKINILYKKTPLQSPHVLSPNPPYHVPFHLSD